ADLLLGRCYAQLNQPDREFAAFERLAQRNPSSLTARTGMAEAARNMGRVEDAIKLLDQIIQLPETPAGARSEQVRMLMVRAQQRNRAADWSAVDQKLDELANGRQVPAAELSVLRAEYLVLRDRSDQART